MIKNHIAYNPVASEWKFKIAKAKGSFIWDEKGKKLIDFTSGWNVANLGWNHPEISQAMIEQIRKGSSTYSCLWSSCEIQEQYAEELAKTLPKELNTFVRATGGTEANEEALKIARAATGRKKIVGFKDAYHGQSFAAMSIGYRPEYVKSIAPMLPDVIQIDFPSTYKTGKSEKQTLDEFLDALETILRKKDIAAIITEAGIITGWGSTHVAPNNYLASVRKLTREYGTLLILDEVGTGFSRCGKLFGMEIEGVVPDIATFAKGMSNGAAAIGAVAVNDNLIAPTLSKTNLTSTFGWMPVSCAAALATLRIHKRDTAWKQAQIKGNWLRNELKRKLASHPKLDDIRGIGMEIGVVFVKDKKTKEADTDFCQKVIEKAYKKGLHIVYGDEGSIQLMPPLTIEQEVLDEGIDIFAKSIKE